MSRNQIGTRAERQAKITYLSKITRLKELYKRYVIERREIMGNSYASRSRRLQQVNIALLKLSKDIKRAELEYQSFARRQERSRAFKRVYNKKPRTQENKASALKQEPRLPDI